MVLLPGSEFEPLLRLIEMLHEIVPRRVPGFLIGAAPADVDARVNSRPVVHSTVNACVNDLIMWVTLPEASARSAELKISTWSSTITYPPPLPHSGTKIPLCVATHPQMS